MYIDETKGPAFFREMARLFNSGEREQIVVGNGDLVPDTSGGVFFSRLVSDAEAVASNSEEHFDVLFSLSAGQVSFANSRSEKAARDSLRQSAPVDGDDEYSALAVQVLGQRSDDLFSPDDPCEKVALATRILLASNRPRGLIVVDAENLFPAQEGDKQLLDNLTIWRSLANERDDVLVAFLTRDAALLHPHLVADVGGAVIVKVPPARSEYLELLKTLRLLHPETFNGHPLQKIAEAAETHRVGYKGLWNMIEKCEAEGEKLSPAALKRCLPLKTDGSEVLASEKPGISFDDVAGLEPVKTEIRRRAILPIMRPDDARLLGLSPGGGVLLYGPPGCAKTMTAQAVAGELDAPLFAITPADILSKWYGESEQKVRQLFDTMRQAAERFGLAVLFVDEVDGLVRDRDAADNEATQRVVAQFLTELNGFRARGNILFIAATNKPWLLDEAFRRSGRIDVEIHVPLPDLAARKELWRLHLHGRAHGKVNIGRLAEGSEGFSGADVKALCETAAQRALERAATTHRKPAISMSDLKGVLGESSPSVDSATISRYEEYAKHRRGA